MVRRTKKGVSRVSLWLMPLTGVAAGSVVIAATLAAGCAGHHLSPPKSTPTPTSTASPTATAYRDSQCDSNSHADPNADRYRDADWRRKPDTRANTVYLAADTVEPIGSTESEQQRDR